MLVPGPGRPTGPSIRSILAAVALLLAAQVAVAGQVGAVSMGRVSGVVTGGGRSVANAWVSLIPTTPTGNWDGRAVVTTTDGRGRYAFDDVSADHVKIQVRGPSSGGLVSTYWPHAYTLAGAGVLRVTASGGSVADVDLVRGGSLSGRVVDARTGTPVPGARVTAHVAGSVGWEPVGTAALGADRERGSFLLRDVPPTPVTLHVHAPETSNYLDQWFDDAGHSGAALQLSGGIDTSGLVVSLREGGEVRGTIRDDAGTPVAGAEVTLTRCAGACPRAATTDASGRYRITVVPPGVAMLLRVRPDAPNLLGQWYRAPGSAAESRLVVEPGQVLSSVDVVLQRGAVLRATILDDRTGAPLVGASARLLSLSDPLQGYFPADLPDAGGPVLVGPMPPGSYRLVVSPGVGNRAYLPVTWAKASGVAPDGAVVLAAGDQVDATVRLVGQPSGLGFGGSTGSCRGDSEAPGAASAGASEWPGSLAGLLTAERRWVGAPT